MTEAPSVCICSRPGCGETAPLHQARLSGWLVRELKDRPGRWLVRCPEHASRRARHAVGLPERGSLLRVGRLIDRGLELELDDVIWLAERVDCARFPYSLQCWSADRITYREPLFYSSLEQLCDAMALVAALDRWKVSHA